MNRMNLEMLVYNSTSIFQELQCWEHRAQVNRLFSNLLSVLISFLEER
jgi:hypothetical protein